MNNKEVLKMDDVTLLQQDENGTNNYRFCNHNLRCTKAFANEMQKKGLNIVRVIHTALKLINTYYSNGWCDYLQKFKVGDTTFWIISDYDNRMSAEDYEENKAELGVTVLLPSDY